LATLKEIKGRIGAVKNTQKITRAMKMVATAKLRRAQERITAARPYANKLNELLRQIASATEEVVNPLMEQRAGKRTLVVVITADRGLAGSFNTNTLKFANNYLKTLADDTKVVAVGRKSSDFFRRIGITVFGRYINIFNDLRVETAQEISDIIVQGYLNNEYDRVDIIYNSFKSIAKQEVVREQFLPFTAEKNEGQKVKKIDYIYEPGAKEILNDLIPRQLNMHIWKALLESNAAEQGARMTAMETATKNATDLIQYLDLQYNRARQEAITKEILEIVGGAEALKEA
jgi:F-type H+-transporting ATPase subunit gamma